MTIAYLGEPPAGYAVPAGQTLRFAHGVGSFASFILVSDGIQPGVLLTVGVDIQISQPDTNTVEIQNLGLSQRNMIIRIEWPTSPNENIPADDSRLSIV